MKDAPTELEALTQDYGRDIFARLSRDGPFPLSPAWFDDQLMDWTMSDPTVKVQLFRFIDWLLQLPEELEKRFDEEIEDYQKEKTMPYISSLERRAMERGRKEGREEARGVVLEGIELILRSKFGDASSSLTATLRDIKDLEKLRSLQQQVIMAGSLEDVQQAISSEK